MKRKTYHNKRFTQLVCRCGKSAARISTPYLEKYYDGFGIEAKCCNTRLYFYPHKAEDK